jgi:hypothetical protein
VFCGNDCTNIRWLVGWFIARIDRKTGDSLVVETPTPNQGARPVQATRMPKSPQQETPA